MNEADEQPLAIGAAWREITESRRVRYLLAASTASG